MKLTKKALLLALALTLALTTIGCSSKEKTSDAPITIGILQSIEHPALDATYEGFAQALADNGYPEGKVQLDLQNAQGDISNLSTISDRFVSKDVDLVLAISTDAAQAIAGKTTEIPILATAVTSYTSAGLVESEELPGGNLSGTSDMNPVAAQIQLITELVPEVKTIGLIYNSSEDNSVLQIDLAKQEIQALGLDYAEATVTNSSEVQQAIQSLVGKSDAIYIPTDNTLASAMATVHGVTGEAKIPTICGADTMVLEGGLATMGINYYDLGYKTGLMAVEVLEGKNPGDLPIQYADSSDIVTINGQVAEEIGFQVPEKYADTVIYPEN